MDPLTARMRPLRHTPTGVRAVLAAAAIPLAPLAVESQTPTDSRHCSRIVATDPDLAAVSRAERVIADEPDGALAAFYRGCRAWREKGTGKAVGHFERAAKLAPDNGTIHDWIGRAYGEQIARVNFIRQGMLAGRVRGSFERAVELDPDNVEAREHLSRYYFHAPRIAGGSHAKGWEQIEEIRRRDPYRGGMLAAQRHLVEKGTGAALLEYRRLAAQYPDSSTPRSALAELGGAAPVGAAPGAGGQP